MITYSMLGNNGRLTNQIFQIAATIGLARRNNDSFILPPWQYENDFNLHNCFGYVTKTHTYTEPHFQYANIPYHNTNDMILDLAGYYQDFRYIDHCKDEVINLLTPVHHFERESGLCAIHWRVGDYINFQDCHPLMTREYFEKAMELSGCHKFLIFSDSMHMAKDMFRGNQFEFSEGNSPTVDMALMSKKCEHNIISNSSFSLWAAFINKSPNKKVIGPIKWFGEKLNYHDTSNLLLPEWVKI